MKNKVFYGIMIRIIILFTIGMVGTFVSDSIQDTGFFGDKIHVCSQQDCYSNYSGESSHLCANRNDPVDKAHDWGARHYWYFWMCITLFLLAFANIIISIINVVNKNYPDI